VVDQIAEKLDKESKQPPLVEAAVRYTVGALFMDLGRLPEAYRHLNRSYEIYQKERGERHEDTIRCMLRLGGLTYRHLRSPEEAERIVRRAWGLAREVLGPDHLTTLIAMRDMALLHTAQGRMQEGEDLLEQFRAGCVRTRGEADTWSVTALVFLAFHYLWQGKSDRAEEYATRAVELRRKHQGADHYLTLFAEQALAVTHISQDRFDQAEALYRHIAKGMRHHLGENSFGELTARAFLGLTLSQQGKHEEAVAVLREVIPLLRQRQSDGWLSFPLWSSLTNLGESLNRLARFEEAEPVLREALKIRLITFGSTKRRYHYSQSNLGETLTGLKRFQDAEGQLLAARKGLLTPQSIPLDERWRLRDESATLERLVRLYDAWSKPDEAAKWRKELEARKAAGKKP
jgi:tetratricopeptide (TPR) repeat protein